jgi:uroporphyrinogen decarboxylase
MDMNDSMDMNPKPTDPLMARLLRGEPVERTPVWAMRQAGRWDPEFRQLREGKTFFEFSENAELAAAASLCPRRFGVDAIILFYDITTLAVSMGQPFDLVPARGPVPRKPIQSTADVARLAADPDPSTYQHILDIYDIVARDVAGQLPILVFAGAPFTMAAYQTGIGRDLSRIRDFIQQNRSTWDALLARTAEATISFLKVLMKKGAAAYQLFDSWAGGLSQEEYLRFCQPWHELIFREVTGPSILFVKELPYVDHAARTGCRVLSLGTTHSLGEVKRRHPNLLVQGNVDHLLLVEKSPAEVREATLKALRDGEGERHILNLDHGMDPNARVENFAAFIETAKSI